MGERDQPVAVLPLAAVALGVAAAAAVVTARWKAIVPKPEAPARAAAASPIPAKPRPAETAPPASRVVAPQAPPPDSVINPPPEVIEPPPTAEEPAEAEPEQAEAASPGTVLPAAGPPKPPLGPLSRTTVKRIDDVWIRFTTRSKAVGAYRASLYKDPRIKPLIEKYLDDRDLWGFAKAALGSGEFRTLTVKAFASPDMAKMLLQMIRSTPPDELEKANREIKHSDVAGKLLQDVSKSSGLPVATLLAGKAPSQEELMRSAAKDPKLLEVINSGIPQKRETD